MGMRGYLEWVGLVVFAGSLAFGSRAAAVQLEPGDLVVASQFNNSIVHVDPVSGIQTLITAGGFLSTPKSVVVDAQGAVFVCNSNHGDIIEVDPLTGAQSVLNAGGLGMSSTVGIAVDGSGNVVTTDDNQTVVRVNRQTGVEQAVSIGGGLSNLTDVAIEASGQLLAVNFANEVHRVDPTTGGQTLIGAGLGLFSLAVESPTSAFGGDVNANTLVRVDLTTGTSTVLVSDPPIVGVGVAFDEAAGFVYVATTEDNVFRYDVSTGAVGLVSTGGMLGGVFDVAVVPQRGCPAVPASACSSGGKGTIRLKKGSDSSRDSMTWKLKKGSFGVADFGSPDVDTNTAFCLYANDVLVMSAAVGAAGTCDGKPCWKPLGSRGFKYKNRDGNAAGITKINLKDGTGNASILIKGKGANLAPPLPLTFGSGVRAQLIRFDSAQCWESEFPTFLKSDDDSFKAKF